MDKKINKIVVHDEICMLWEKNKEAKVERLYGD